MSVEPDRIEASRRDLATALRELRLAAGLSGERLAVRCSMSQAKISRIETGKTLPTVLDVERILKALDVPADIVTELISLARRANVDYVSWRSIARIGPLQKQAELRALERSATVVRHFLPSIPPGLLHTREYAARTLAPMVPSEQAIDVPGVVRVRLERQAALDDADRTFAFLMTEQAVRWRLASPEIMVAQLGHMAGVAAKPGVELAIVPQSAEVVGPPLNGFVIYDDRLVTVELFSGEVVLRDPRDVAFHLELFDYFLQHAATGDDAIALLRALADEFM
ncbi:MAG TPA: helix-turn-helix transcriptional regulator [Actinophytocola sp.]|uniref:helix-turn-helix domain-containing protein n=1 Tax=Actinophytocola sp. TaxID=1872138 RepID=UPI002DF7E494|nr:helix-turn-helix transcriptional regulator [Actinophytocola sp.]